VLHSVIEKWLLLRGVASCERDLIRGGPLYLEKDGTTVLGKDHCTWKREDHYMYVTKHVMRNVFFVSN
jgi:hypothetical protein